MPRVCTICQHPDRKTIDQALAAGRSVRETAALCRVSEDALGRHQHGGHVAEVMVKAHEQAEVDHGIDLNQQLKAANTLAWQIASDARKGGDPNLALKALDRILRQLELVAELTEQLDRRPVVNVLLSPEWLRVRTVIVQALAPFPDARGVVASRLMALESEHGRGD